MLERLLDYSLSHRIATFVLTVVLLAVGLFAFKNLTIEAFPDPTDTQVQLITLFSGQPTEEVERRVSLPLERALNGTPGLTRLRSISLFGLSFLTMTFDDATDPMRALQDWVISPRLLQVPGVADVVSYGGLVREVHVEPDVSKMVDLGVNLNDVFAALKKASANATGGYVERGSEMFVIRSLGIFSSIDDLQHVRVGYNKTRPVELRDVAKVNEGYAPRQGVVTRDSNQDAVEGIVLMRRGENPTVVLDALRDRVAKLSKTLPADVKIKPFYDRTELVNTTLKTVFENLAEGAALVMLVLFAFMLSLRASLIAAAVIPLSLAARSEER